MIGVLEQQRGTVANLFLNTFPMTSGYAFSLAKLDRNYSGPCIKVRRSSDNTELDIGFVGDYLDTASLLSFVGAGDGFVKQWYDQGPLSDNTFQQATNANQPQIVSSGALLVDSQGFAKIVFNGTNSVLNSNIGTPVMNPETFDFTILNLWDSEYYSYIKGTNSSSWSIRITEIAALTDRTGVVTTSPSVAAAESVIASAFPNRKLTTSILKQGVTIQHSVNATDGTAVSCGSNLRSATATATVLGRTVLGAYVAMAVQESINYHSDESANVAAMKADRNAYYSIY